MAPSRPPGQYVLAPGTQFCLIANEYDKNTYTQCAYVSHRTLIRCKQIRPKEELAKNGGKCEEHDELSKMLKRNHQKEMHRIKAECDNSNGKRSRFDAFIVSNDYVSDEDEWIQPGGAISNEFPDQIFESFLDDEPLRHSEYFTEKDVLRIKLKMVTSDLDDYRAFRDLLEAQASKICEKVETTSKTATLDFAQHRAYEASTHYGSKDYLKISKKTSIPQGPPCAYGRDKDDETAIQDIMNAMLCEIENKNEYVVKIPCPKPSITKAEYCTDHIIFNTQQQIFAQCSICGDVAIATDDPMCSFHLKEFVNIRATHPNHNVRRGDENVKSLSSETNFDRDRVKLVEIDDSDEEEKLGNLSRIETMSSPFASSLNRKVRYGSPHIMRQSQAIKDQSAAQKVVANMMVAGAGAINVFGSTNPEIINEIPLDDGDMGCARARGYCKIEKNDAKVVKVVPTPRVLPSSTRPNYVSKPPPYQAQYRSQRYTNYQGPTKRANPSTAPAPAPRAQHVPKQIPLERRPETDETEEHVQYTRIGRDVPRGVPYVSQSVIGPKAQQHRVEPRSSFIAPQRRTSGVPVGPPPQPQPIGPTRSSLPAPPHRMFAMGAKPVDIVDPATPRPSFDPAVRQQQQQQQQQKQQTEQVDSSSEQSSSLSTSAVPTSTAGGPATNSSPTKYARRTLPPNQRTYTVVSQSGRYASMDASRLVVNANFAEMKVKEFLEMTAENQRILLDDSDPQYFSPAPLPPPPPPPENLEVADQPPVQAAAPLEQTMAPPQSPPQDVRKPVEVPIIPLERISPKKSPRKAANIPKVAEPVEKGTIEETIEQVANNQIPTPEIRKKGAPIPQPLIAKSTPSIDLIKISPPPAPPQLPVAESESLNESIPPPVLEPATIKPIHESRKRKAAESVGAVDEPTAKKKIVKETPVTPTRTPRAAAIAANQAISHSKPSTSTPTSASRREMPTLVRSSPMNPLDVLAAVSEIEEKKERRKSIDNISPRSASSTNSTKANTAAQSSKTSPRAPPRRSTRGKGGGESEKD